jgi:hypothetical protein
MDPRTGIRDGKKDPESGINILDPQHWVLLSGPRTEVCLGGVGGGGGLSVVGCTVKWLV